MGKKDKKDDKKKKEKKEKKEKKDDEGDKKKKKKDDKKDKKKADDSGSEASDKKKKKKDKKKEVEEEVADLKIDSSDDDSVDSDDSDDSDKPEFSSSDFDFGTVEYFDARLAEIRYECQRLLSLESKEKKAFSMMCQNYYDAWTEKRDVQKKLSDLMTDGTPAREIKRLQEGSKEFSARIEKTLVKRQKWCVKSALAVFGGLKPDVMEKVESKLAEGAIIAQAAPQKLSDFAQESKENKKVLKRLFDDPDLMKDMLTHGGVTGNAYGEAARIYDECMEDVEDEDDDDFKKVHSKIAMACALELASPIYEFDTDVRVDPYERYEHFVDAHREGELDPAFPFFSIWEMRQIVNCDATNEQMEWIRMTIINYVPFFTLLEDFTQRYLHIINSDVKHRNPTWDKSPRTYQMILSGGGNANIHAWFGRFILKSYGIPCWSATENKKEGYAFWSPEGWKVMNGIDWDNSSWKGKNGRDFKTEIEARNKAPPKEYFKKLITLQCLADMFDGDPNAIPAGERDVLHPDRIWRSMSVVSMLLLDEADAGTENKFLRTGDSLVETNCEIYLEKYHADAEDDEVTFDDVTGKLVIPASRCEKAEGNFLINDAFEGGKQVNFAAFGTAFLEYKIPDEVPAKTYTISLEICTVSSQQVPLKVEFGDSVETCYKVKMHYTEGYWEKTRAVPVKVEGGQILRISRPKGSLGLAIKKMVFNPLF